MNKTMRYIVGYTLGITLFIFLIPLGLYKLSKFDNLFNSRVLFSSRTLKDTTSLLLLLVGTLFMIWSNIFLLIVGKGGPTEGFGVAISPSTKKLVTNGPYRYSRNPMVFGAFTIYTAWVFYLNSITGLICLFAFLLTAIIYLKFSEEKRLLKDFGDEYINYRKKVSMIIPIKRLKRHSTCESC